MAELISDAFTADPRLARAKELLLEALRDHQARIYGIQPSNSDLKASYDAMIEEFGTLRGGGLFYPYLGSGIGNGALVELADGSVKYDFISGIGVHHWGHSHPAIVEACIDAALRDTVMQGNLQQDVATVDLARLILTAANQGGAALDHVFFTSSGAMANENALKVIFQKKHPADRLLAFSGCFMGRTLTLSQVTDKADYRQGLPPTLHVDYVPFFDPSQPEQSTGKAVTHVKGFLERYPGRHAAMIFELVQGEGGFNPGDGELFRALMELCREHGIAVMVDEIQTFGRTTELFGLRHFGLDRYVDVVTIGKLAQFCATLFTGEYKPRPGLLSQTFTAGTSALFAGKVIIQGLLDGGYFGPDGKIARLHAHVVRRLQEIEARHPDLIHGPFGLGAMIAFTPFHGEPARVKTFIRELFKAGVIAFSCGSHEWRVRFLIPVGTVTMEQIDEVCSIVEETLVRVGQQERSTHAGQAFQPAT